MLLNYAYVCDACGPFHYMRERDEPQELVPCPMCKRDALQLLPFAVGCVPSSGESHDRRPSRIGRIVVEDCKIGVFSSGGTVDIGHLESSGTREPVINLGGDMRIGTVNIKADADDEPSR